MQQFRIFEYSGHWLVSRPDTPNYYIYWCRPGTRRVLRKSTGTQDLEQAKQRLIDFADKANAPLRKDPSDVLVANVLADYLERELAKKPSEAWGRDRSRHLLRYFELNGIHDVGQITLDMQDDYVAWRRNTAFDSGKSLSNGTLNGELAILRAAIRHRWKRGGLTYAPHVKSLPKPPPRQRHLTESECRRLLHSCHEVYLKRYVLLALNTLQRPSAILGLHADQIDLATLRIDFLPPGQAQSHKRRPIVPINSTLATTLESALEESETGFVIEYRGKPIKSIKHSLRNACDRTGLEGVTPYTLRHTGATLLAANGVPMRQIAGMLGHTTQRTTEMYAKHAPEYLQEASSTLDRMFRDAA